jgi:hypothetical protein
VAIFYNFKLAAAKRKLKKYMRLLKRYARMMKNRRIQMLNRAHQIHMDARKQEQKRDEARFQSAFGKGKGKTRSKAGRGRQRSRSRDRDIKRSAREEQTWKLKTDAMREKARDRKKEAMNRWSMTATSGGAFRGI